MKSVREESMTVSGTSNQFSVPKKTLDDRIKGHVKHGYKPGPSTAVTAEEESVLTACLLYMAEHGFPMTSKKAMGFAWAVSIRSGTQHRFNADSGPGKHCFNADSRPGKHWWHASVHVILSFLSAQLITLSIVK